MQASTTSTMVSGLINREDIHAHDLTESTVITLADWYHVAAPLASAVP